MYNEKVILARVEGIRERIAAACDRSGRALSEIQIVAVTKTHPVEALVAAWHAGIRNFGENRVQDAAPKFALIPTVLPEARKNGLRLHMIGHLQTNKAKTALDVFDLIHSVDSLKLASELEKQATKKRLSAPILIQVNISGEESKSGIAPDAVDPLVEHILGVCPHLVIEGYMTMAPFVDDSEIVRPCFHRLREIRDKMASLYSGEERYRGLELSMGMTNDYEIAVEEGATLVRIGTAIFGMR